MVCATRSGWVSKCQGYVVRHRAGVLLHERGDLRHDLSPEARAVEHAVVTGPDLEVVGFLLSREGWGEVQSRARLADSGDVVLLALDRHQSTGPDGREIHRLAPV